MAAASPPLSVGEVGEGEEGEAGEKDGEGGEGGGGDRRKGSVAEFNSGGEVGAANIAASEDGASSAPREPEIDTSSAAAAEAVSETISARLDGDVRQMSEGNSECSWRTERSRGKRKCKFRQV